MVTLPALARRLVVVEQDGGGCGVAMGSTLNRVRAANDTMSTRHPWGTFLDPNQLSFLICVYVCVRARASVYTSETGDA